MWLLTDLVLHLSRFSQNMHQAHKVLQHEAVQLRSIFPNGLSMQEFTARARQTSNTAGAPDVLNFLRNHMSKVSSYLAMCDSRQAMLCD